MSHDEQLFMHLDRQETDFRRDSGGDAVVCSSKFSCAAVHGAVRS